MKLYPMGWITRVMSHDFSGRTVVITGASGGIGRAIALEFARGGANVVINYHCSPQRAYETLQMVREADVGGIAIRADVSSPEEVSEMVHETVDTFGGIDVLVNNAAQRPPPFFDLESPDWELWTRMVEVNLKGPLVCSREVAPHLRRRDGNIVNLVIRDPRGGVGYSMTKEGADTITRGLARKLSPIRVNAVSPGTMDTWGMTEEERTGMSERTLVKRVGDPSDVAHAVAFLASEEASYITGETLMVDGGTGIVP